MDLPAQSLFYIVRVSHYHHHNKQHVDTHDIFLTLGSYQMYKFDTHRSIADPTKNRCLYSIYEKNQTPWG